MFRKRMLVALFVAFSVAQAREICDKTKCPGPLKFYEELSCTPIYKNSGDCCPEAYNCTHLMQLDKTKCYVNGRQYNIGERLMDDDANPCDISCTCQKGYKEHAAMFICAQVDCFWPRLEPNCFFRYKSDQCCPEGPICLKPEEERAKCLVDGKEYLDGEHFKPESNPELNCNCMPGYEGRNEPPFCKKQIRGDCDLLFHRADEIHQNCAPVYQDYQNPQTDCSYSSRCPNKNDSVTRNKSPIETDENKVCRFGNVTMNIGDTLNEGTEYDSVCVKCVCELPPLPTCWKENVNCLKTNVSEADIALETKNRYSN